MPGKNSVITVGQGLLLSLMAYLLSSSVLSIFAIAVVIIYFILEQRQKVFDRILSKLAIFNVRHSWQFYKSHLVCETICLHLRGSKILKKHAR